MILHLTSFIIRLENGNVENDISEQTTSQGMKFIWERVILNSYTFIFDNVLFIY